MNTKPKGRVLPVKVTLDLPALGNSNTGSGAFEVSAALPVPKFQKNSIAPERTVEVLVNNTSSPLQIFAGKVKSGVIEG